MFRGQIAPEEKFGDLPQKEERSQRDRMYILSK